MSLLIKGMKTPSFPAFREKGNKVTFPAAVVLEKGKKPLLLVGYKIGLIDHDLKTYELVEIPTPHGRLIDADKLLEAMGKAVEKDRHWVNFFAIVKESPTIIEAEASE